MNDEVRATCPKCRTLGILGTACKSCGTRIGRFYVESQDQKLNPGDWGVYESLDDGWKYCLRATCGDGETAEAIAAALNQADPELPAPV